MFFWGVHCLNRCPARYEEWKAATQDQSLNPDGCRDRAWQDARAMGQDAVDLLLEVEKELVSRLFWLRWRCDVWRWCYVAHAMWNHVEYRTMGRYISPLGYAFSVCSRSSTQEQEKDLRKRGRVLRKLLVKLHPDQNRGQEKVWWQIADLGNQCIFRKLNNSTRQWERGQVSQRHLDWGHRACLRICAGFESIRYRWMKQKLRELTSYFILQILDL